ncbi:MAG: chromate transporter [Clostridia bacterium]
MKMKEYTRLFTAFFKIGLFTFGGGYAMLPMLQKEVVDKNQWADDKEILDYFAIGQSAPGIIAINTATFIGYKVGKIKGALAATLGVAMPSLIIITLIAAFLKEYSGSIHVQKALAGIRGAVVSLIAVGVIRMIGKSHKTLQYFIFAGIGLLLLLVVELSPVYIVLSAILAGIMLTAWKRRKKQ